MDIEGGVITDVEDGEGYYAITMNGWGFGLSKEYGVIPIVGDVVSVTTAGGSTIRGVVVNNQLVFYKSDEQLEVERQEWLAKHEQEKQERFEQEKDRLDTDYNTLPDNFKRRIDRFRANNPRFRVDYESYEMFTCKEALKIANARGTYRKVQTFAKVNWEKQKELVPSLSDGHSGNTFSMAARLAYIHLRWPEEVAQVHGALSVLVGSKDYGDIPPEEAKSE